MGLFLPGNDRRWASYDLEVAEKLGINEAIILAQIISSIEGHIDGHLTERFFRDGQWWMYDSFAALSKSTALGQDAVRRTLLRLDSLKIIRRFQYELALGYGRYWYTIDAQILTKALGCTPPMQNHRVPPPTHAKPQGATHAKPQGATHAKPHGLSITLIPINPISITHKIYTSQDSITAMTIKKPKKERSPMNPEELELGKVWHAYAKENLKTKPYSSWSDKYFAEALVKVMKSTGTNIQGMHEILIFLKGDQFWKSNAISPASLVNLSKANGKRKIDNILDAMERAKKGGNRYERAKAIDYSADNGRYANCNDDKPW